MVREKAQCACRSVPSVVQAALTTHEPSGRRNESHSTDCGAIDAAVNRLSTVSPNGTRLPSPSRRARARRASSATRERSSSTAYANRMILSRDVPLPSARS